MATHATLAHDDQIILMKAESFPLLLNPVVLRAIPLQTGLEDNEILYKWSRKAHPYIQRLVIGIGFQVHGGRYVFDREEAEAICKLLGVLLEDIGPDKHFSTIQQLPWLLNEAGRFTWRLGLSSDATECSPVLDDEEHTFEVRDNIEKMKAYIARRNSKSSDTVSFNRLFHATQGAWTEALRVSDQKRLFQDLRDLNQHFLSHDARIFPYYSLAKILDETRAYCNQTLVEEQHPWGRKRLVGETRLAKPDPYYPVIGLALVYEIHGLGRKFTTESIAGLKRPAPATPLEGHDSKRFGVRMSRREMQIYDQLRGEKHLFSTKSIVLLKRPSSATLHEDDWDRFGETMSLRQRQIYHK